MVHQNQFQMTQLCAMKQESSNKDFLFNTKEVWIY